MCHVRNDRGFSLIEALVAVVLMGIMLASLFGMFSTGIGIQHAADMKGTASDFANDGVEMMRALFNANDLDNIVTPAPNPVTVAPGFDRSLAVDPAGSAPNRIWTVTSTVTYTVNGVEKNVSYQTVLAEP